MTEPTTADKPATEEEAFYDFIEALDYVPAAGEQDGLGHAFHEGARVGHADVARLEGENEALRAVLRAAVRAIVAQADERKALEAKLREAREDASRAYRTGAKHALDSLAPAEGAGEAPKEDPNGN